MNEKRFDECIIKYANKETKYNIGTYQEKTLHKVIKNYYCEDINYQEVKVGKVISDICIDNNIFEVQNGNFNKLVPKLKEYGDNYNVNIIYPIPYEKYIYWLDPDTGEVKDIRKSPKKGTIYDSFKELYKIKWFLPKPNIHIILLLIDVIEYRNLNGWNDTKKRGSTRHDRIPKKLIDEITINDFHMFIPNGLPKEFTSNDYKKFIKRRINDARTGLTILQYLDIIEVIRKEGKKNIYRVK